MTRFALRRSRLAVASILTLTALAFTASCGEDTEYRALLDDLTNGSNEKQYEAAVELGRQKERRAVDAMTHVIEDDDPYVREAVAWALGEIGDPAAVESLSRAAAGDESETVRENAVYSLGQIGDAVAVAPLMEIFLGEARPNIEAYEAGQDEPNPALLAAFSLRRIGAPAIAPLAAAAGDEDLTVRRVALATLGEIGLDTGDYSGVPALTEALSDDEALIRETAAHSLIITGDPASLTGLEAALEAWGTERMAGFFLGSGQQQLVEAATAWVQANGLDLEAVRCSVDGRAKWGSFDPKAVAAGCAGQSG
ncbi:MAG: HEAT repeat domain-containing protein [Gaiellales bacterium]|nr:MAG: HEAT repeat domain-containing protein [Gaiellales bacterium]